MQVQVQVQVQVLVQLQLQVQVHAMTHQDCLGASALSEGGGGDLPEEVSTKEG